MDFKILTSYYSNTNITHFYYFTIAISGKPPEDYKGQTYKKLAPSWNIYSEYKRSNNSDRYTDRYIKEILEKLDPHEVLNDIIKLAATKYEYPFYNVKPYIVLLCYEKPSEFCHRHIVSSWLNLYTGIEIKEL